MESALLAVTLASLILLVVAWRRFYRRLRAKGRSRLLIIASFSVLLLGCLVAYTSIAGEASPDNPRTMLVFAVPALVWIPLAALVARALPARGPAAPRAAGRRSSLVPHRFLGWASHAVAIALIVFMIWQLISPEIVPRKDSWRIIVAVLVALGAGEYWLGLARRIRTAPTVLPRTQNSVLYLRAFGDEQRPFVSGPASILRQYTNQFTAKMAIVKRRSDPKVSLTLDDFLGEAIDERIGPFVALGNPVDTLPPDGAIREYAPDAKWQERFTQLASDASCIVIAFGESRNLEWELDQIRQGGMCQKVCLFTPPLTFRKNDFGTLRQSVAEAKALRSTLASSWAAAAEVLNGAGYDCDPVCPGFGAAVMFDEAGKSVVLTSEASTPAEFVAPVADWLKTRTRTGRHVAATCGSCGTRVYQAADAADGALCFVCRGEAKIAGMSGLDRTFERYPLLPTAWALASFVITGGILMILPFRATWFVIVVWLLVFVAPWPIAGAIRRVRRTIGPAAPQ